MYNINGNPYFNPCLTKQTKSYEMNSFDETGGSFLLFLKFPSGKNQLHNVWCRITNVLILSDRVKFVFFFCHFCPLQAQYYIRFDSMAHQWNAKLPLFSRRIIIVGPVVIEFGIWAKSVICLSCLYRELRSSWINCTC